MTSLAPAKPSFGTTPLGENIVRLKKSTVFTKQATINLKKVTERQFTFERKKIALDKRERVQADQKSKRKIRETNLERTDNKFLEKLKNNRITKFAGNIADKALAAFTSLMLGWLIDKLPAIIETIKTVIAKIKRLIEIGAEMIATIGKIVKGSIDVAVQAIKNIASFDFTDSEGKLKEKLDILKTNTDDLGSQWDEASAQFLNFLKDPEAVRKSLGKDLDMPPTTGGGEYASADEKQLTESLIAAEEGVRTKAYQDTEGIWTIGYGQTRINGRPVKEGDTITKEQALSGFRGAVDEHRNRAIRQVGMDEWKKLDPRTRAALTSIAYNYGSLPQRIMGAVRTGDSERIAASFSKLEGDNDGVLKGRRRREAAIIRGTQGTSDNPIRLDKDFLAGGKFAGATTGPSVGGTTRQSTPTRTIQGATPGKGVLTAHYGEKRGSKRHGGTDIAAPSGTALVAPTKGKIVDYGSLSESGAKRGDPKGWGNFLVFQDEKGLFHLYGHLLEGFKKSGNIQKGEVIGKVGSTGKSTAPHLHWELGSGWSGGRLTGKRDPLSVYGVQDPFTVSSPAAQTRTIGRTQRDQRQEKSTTVVVNESPKQSTGGGYDDSSGGTTTVDSSLNTLTYLQFSL